MTRSWWMSPAPKNWSPRLVSWFNDDGLRCGLALEVVRARVLQAWAEPGLSKLSWARAYKFVLKASLSFQNIMTELSLDLGWLRSTQLGTKSLKAGFNSIKEAKVLCKKFDWAFQNCNFSLFIASLTFQSRAFEPKPTFSISNRPARTWLAQLAWLPSWFD